MRKKTLGVLLIIAPAALLIATMTAYAVASFVMIGMRDGGNETFTSMAGMTVNVVLGGIGFVCVLGIIPALIGGIVVLSKRDEAEMAALKAHPKYAGLTEDQIAFIARPSFGAFFCTLVWGIGNKLYGWAVASLVPIVAVYPWLKLTIDGRRMAWEEGRWQDFEQFRKRQTIVAWTIVGLIVTVLALRFINVLGGRA